MKEILTGLRAAAEPEWDAAFDLEWAGYAPYQVAAPLGKMHLTRVQLQPAASGRRYEYVFPGGLLRVSAMTSAMASAVTMVLALIGSENGWSLARWLASFTQTAYLWPTMLSPSPVVGPYCRGILSLNLARCRQRFTPPCAIEAGWPRPNRCVRHKSRWSRLWIRYGKAALFGVG